MKEYKVGERFYYDGVLLEVCEDASDRCHDLNCYFGNCSGDGKYCFKSDRADNKYVHYKQVKQDCIEYKTIDITCSCGNKIRVPIMQEYECFRCHKKVKAKRTETRLKKPEELLKVLIDGGWKPKIVDDELYFIHDTELDFCSDLWRYCGYKTPEFILYSWHPSWLEEVEV